MPDESYTHTYTVTDCCDALHSWHGSVHSCNECGRVNPVYHETERITIKVGSRVGLTKSHCKWSPWPTDEQFARRGVVVKLDGPYPTIKWDEFQKDSPVHIGNLRVIEEE